MQEELKPGNWFYQLNYGVPRHSLARVGARLTDALLLLALNLVITQKLDPPLVWLSFLLYYACFAALDGRTLGRRLWLLRYETTNLAFPRLLFRELIFFLFSWVVFIEFLFSTRPYIQDRFMGIIVRRA